MYLCIRTQFYSVPPRTGWWGVNWFRVAEELGDHEFSDGATPLVAFSRFILASSSNPINIDNTKVIIFTTFADTAKYLYKIISKWALDEFGLHSALVTGGGDNKTTLKGVTVTDLNDMQYSQDYNSQNDDVQNLDTQNYKVQKWTEFEI